MLTEDMVESLFNYLRANVDEVNEALADDENDEEISEVTLENLQSLCMAGLLLLKKEAIVTGDDTMSQTAARVLRQDRQDPAL